jgi:DNA adenine methylase
MTDDQHRELAEVLRNVKGKVALSGYHCRLMDELYGDWRRVESKEKTIHSVKTPRKEVLWINYDLEEKAACRPSARRESHRQASLIYSLVSTSPAR